ncbi:MAG: phosphatidylglycerol lysyltransferase domain-containing protein [Phycisphaerae bacterium]|nr:phosphatidylglycerol lysyltransferase domain-containing protein [Phycisphaerae bacterium]
MDEDPFLALRLKRMELADRAVLQPFFEQHKQALSDYTFANTFIWAKPINVHWAILHGCLCVFANGAGDLVLLMPPMGRGDVAAATQEALGRCRIYNAKAAMPQATRIEYVDQAFVDACPPPPGGRVVEMSGDYIYPTQRMIDLDGSDLASKRQSRNRFARLYAARTEDYAPQHYDACMALLARWDAQVQQFANQTGDKANLKRDKERGAVECALRNYRELALTGMVLFADDQLAGFTLGEPLGDDSFSIIIEKTDRAFNGAAQYIFSEFCRNYWADRPWCNAGDDWGIENLARVKASYRPARRLAKYIIFPPPVAKPAGASELLDRLLAPLRSGQLAVAGS